MDNSKNTLNRQASNGDQSQAAASSLINGLLPLFARYEPTTDAIDLAHGQAHRKDVVLYQDAECTKLAARWPWHYSNKPRRNQKTVMFNCWRWRLEWATAAVAA